MTWPSPIHASAPLCPRVKAPFHLTIREYSLLHVLLAGKRQKEIASDLGLSAHTVRKYFNRLYFKLGVRTNVQLVIWAYAHPEDLRLWPSNQK